MYRIVVSCSGVSEHAAIAGIPDILEEFAERPWQENAQCHWDGSRIILQADNDADETGLCLLEEFSDVICACIPIEDTEIGFAIESTGTVPDESA